MLELKIVSWKNSVCVWGYVCVSVIYFTCTLLSSHFGLITSHHFM